MHICSATIRLSGSLNNTVYKDGLTPAEIVVLQNIHGADAVIDILHERDERRSHSEEYARLSALYSRNTNVPTPDGDPGDILQRLFPGAIKRLPVTLAEIGLGEVANMAISVAASQVDAEKALLDQEVENDQLTREQEEMRLEDERRAKDAADAIAAAEKAEAEAKEETEFLANEAAEVAKLNEEAAADEEAELKRLIDEEEAAKAVAAKIKK